MPLKLLAVGDIHIGRRPSKLPSEFIDNVRDLSTSASWNILIDLAIKEGVNVIVLAGDVVESESNYFKGHRELKDGIQRLSEYGVRVLGVAGNHDAEVLPDLAKKIPDFQLIGSKGTWEKVELNINEEWLTIHGYSFPHKKVSQSPLHGISFSRGKGINFGLLHCDLGAHKSEYGPVTSQQLKNSGMEGWLLGHIHTPDKISQNYCTGYLGSLSGMDPSDVGDRGPWLFNIDQGYVQSVTQWVMPPMRWERIELDISELTDQSQARSQLLEYLKLLDIDLQSKMQPPRAVGIRLRLTGRTRLGRKVEEIFTQENQLIHKGECGTQYFIVDCLCETKPKIELCKLAERIDPPGVLARLLLSLDSPLKEGTNTLVAKAKGRLNKLLKEDRWSNLKPKELDQECTVEWLRRTGLRLLEMMLDQQPGTVE